MSSVPPLSASQLAALIAAARAEVDINASVLNRAALDEPLNPAQPQETLRTALTDAIERGVTVRVELPSNDAGETLNRLELCSIGVQVKAFPKPSAPSEVALADQGDSFLCADPSLASRAKGIARQFAAAFSEPVLWVPPPTSESVRLWTMPDDGVSPIVDAIDRAQRSIHMEMFDLQDPAVLAALRRAAERGVDVQVLVEPRANNPSVFDQLVKTLTPLGLKVRVLSAELRELN
jgi:phosphatidylserine/phosphatidylglycerophosphate/cardiolipin synthase-like enzyme